jgi:hypothetical protein
MSYWIYLRFLIRRIYKKRWPDWNSSAQLLAETMVFVFILALIVVIELIFPVKGIIWLKHLWNVPLVVFGGVATLCYFFIKIILSLYQKNIKFSQKKRAYEKSMTIPRDVIIVSLIVYIVFCFGIIFICMIKLLEYYSMASKLGSLFSTVGKICFL